KIGPLKSRHHQAASVRRPDPPAVASTAQEEPPALVRLLYDAIEMSSARTRHTASAIRESRCRQALSTALTASSKEFQALTGARSNCRKVSRCAFSVICSARTKAPTAMKNLAHATTSRRNVNRHAKLTP